MAPGIRPFPRTRRMISIVPAMTNRPIKIYRDARYLGLEVHKAEACEISPVVVVSPRHPTGGFFPYTPTHATFWIWAHHLGLGSRGARRLSMKQRIWRVHYLVGDYRVVRSPPLDQPGS